MGDELLRMSGVIDELAWERLVQYAQRICFDRQDAEDTVQTVLLRSCHWWNAGNHDEREILPYVRSGVYNEAIKLTVRRHVFIALDSTNLQMTTSSDPEHDLSVTEAWHALLTAAESLPKRCRQCFTMVRLLHLSYGTVAKSIGIEPKTVENHVARAERRLRDQLSRWTCTEGAR